MLDHVFSRFTLYPNMPQAVSHARFQATFPGSTLAGPTYVDNTFPSVTTFNRTDMGKTPLTFPDNVPLGPIGDNPQPHIVMEERLGGQTHNPIPVEPNVPRKERLGEQAHNSIPVFDPVPPRVDPEDIAQVLRVHFGMNPQTINRPVYQRPFPERIINDYPLSRSYRSPDFHVISGEDGSSTIEHVGRFTAQLVEIGNNPFYKLQLFGMSLTRTTFSWFVNLPPGQIQMWEGLEMAFHARFFTPLPIVSLTDLLELKQYPEQSASQFIKRATRV
ncbi:uncharacterized protein LOC127254378 [Andrographis paniculata]|uniref:uncharacterized protein LOC127254378 n=1 Tax=Andrographis paniculata TaxID=175694 RepID=UPI0021E7EDC6|nr:uncharacterized protein LOC127254378 [Andrographis paniculata]